MYTEPHQLSDNHDTDDDDDDPGHDLNFGQ